MNRQELIDQIIQSCTNKNATDGEGQIPKAAISILVTREEILKGQIQRHLQLIERAEKKKTKTRHGITLSLQGFDSRKYIEYKEIRTYFQRLFRIKPHMLYYLSQESNLQSILLCLLEIDTSPMGDQFAKYQKGRAEFTFYGADIVSHIRKYIEKSVRYANALKESESAQRELIEYVLDAISYELLTEDAEAI